MLSPTNLTPEQSFQGDESWIDGGDQPAKTPTFEGSSIRKQCADEQVRDLLKKDYAPDDTQVTESQALDTVTFPQHAGHLLPSEPNGTWHAQASYVLNNPSECASAFQEAFGQHVYELDLPKLIHKLEQVAQDRRQDVNNWLNQAFAHYDLVEMHGRVQRLVPALSMPNMRQIDHAIDTAADVAHSVRKRHSESQLLQAHPNDRNIFTEIVGRRAERALVEQGICQEWQLIGDRHEKMLHVMQSFLMHTFKHTQESFANVPLHRAKPQWIADREKNVWRLELDVGRVGVEVGPATDNALIELGSIWTGFELPESCGCLSVLDFDRQVHAVQDEWQLLES